MRKTSQDGGDSTSITSGIENEVKKSTTGIAKIKRSSIKKKVQSFSHESDDGVIEPLLQKVKDKTEFPSQSAKFLLSKTKTDVLNDKMDDKEKLLSDNRVEKIPLAIFSGVPENRINDNKEEYKSSSCTVSAIHNHMNTNIFSNSDTMKTTVVPKSQILVEIDGNKQGIYNSGPLIFTTAKIHTNGKSMQMEPVQVTPVPILSTVEGSIVKTSSLVDNQKVNIGTSGKSTTLLNTDVRKVSEEINKVNINFKTSTGIISCNKSGPTFPRLAGSPDFPNVSSDDKKAVSLTLKSKIPDLLTSGVTISDSKNTTTAISTNFMIPTMSKKAEEITSDKTSIITKDVPKVHSDKKSTIGHKQEIDVNKNFQLSKCSTIPMINSLIEKDVVGIEKKDSSNIKQLQQTNAVEDTKKTESEKTPSISSTNIVAADNDAKNVNEIPANVHANISSKPSLKMTQDMISKSVPVTTSVTKTHQLTDKSTVSVTMPSKTFISTLPPNISRTMSTAKKPNTKTTTINDSDVGKITTSTLSSSSITNPIAAVIPISLVSKISVDPKSVPSNNTGNTRTTSKIVTPASNAKVELGTVSIGKPATQSIPSKSTSSGETLSGKTSLSTNISKFTSTSLVNPMIVSLPKNVSTKAPINSSSNNIVKSNSAIPNKLNSSKDQVSATSSKIRSPIISSTNTGSSLSKPSTSVVSKTQQNSSSLQMSAPSTKLSESTVNTVNVNKKPFTSAVLSKVTQASNVGKTSDNPGISTKASIKSTPSTVLATDIVTATNQNPSTINKSIDLQSNEHKKEKLK